MCMLCSQLWLEDHWAETADDAPGASGPVALETHAHRRGLRLRDRAERARLATLVLAGRGLALRDWEGSSYLLRDRKGSEVVVHDLPAAWAEAERMTGRALDPLDPALLASLRERAGEET